MSVPTNGKPAHGRLSLKVGSFENIRGSSTQHGAARSAPGTPKARANETTTSLPSPSHTQRRASSTPSRPGSSASPRLIRKTSRNSLGGDSPRPEDDNSKRPTPKRSISNLITELRGAHATLESIPEPVMPTAPQIAEACFTRELANHESASARTIVLLHDACYGHRFSRLKTSKGTLSMIVERPERILASVIGIASTYVRLGRYHAGAHNAPRPKRAAVDPPPFKIRRTSRTLELGSTYVTNVHGAEWMGELNTLCQIAEKRLATGEKEVERVASSSGKEKRSLHEGDLYLCKESLDAFQGALGGVADAVDAVFDSSLETSRAFVAVRPPGHHCSADHPSGFCWINNVHVGIEYAAQIHGLTHAAIIDFDLHHGDGSQSIAWERNSSNNYKRLYAKANSKLKLAPDVGYYSLHDINSYPCEMGDDEKVQAASLCVHNAHGQSIWNVHLQPWKTIEEFWTLYETRYLVLLEKATEFLKLHTARVTLEGKQRPKSAIFISAGFDASEWEGEGMQRHKVSVPTDFYARFTSDIAKVAETAGTACDGRIISVLEGGYSDRALCSSTISHLSALAACKTAPNPVLPSGGLGSSMLQSLTPATLDQQMLSLSLTNGESTGYDSSWWSSANLTALEHHVNPPPPVSAGSKKVRVGPQPTYATPTESFAYKVIDPAKFARSVSGTMREGVVPARPLTPPPPEVDWIVATHELSKLLTPSHRTTLSCTPDELAGTKIKKERASDVGLAPSPDEFGKPRQLRARGKPAATARVVSNSDRRKTMADLPSTAAEIEPLLAVPRRPSRRSSMASTTSTASTLQDMTAPPIPSLPPGTAPARPIPARTPSDSMQIKKTRVPVTATATKHRKAPSTTSRRSPAKKAESVMDTHAIAASKSSSPAPTDMSSPVDSETASVDALATGMKRITLKVGTREENDKKAKEKLDADRRARALKAAETRRQNKAARELKEAAERNAHSSVMPSTSLQSGTSLEKKNSYLAATGAALQTDDLTANHYPTQATDLHGVPAYDHSAGHQHYPGVSPAVQTTAYHPATHLMPTSVQQSQHTSLSVQQNMFGDAQPAGHYYAPQDSAASASYQPQIQSQAQTSPYGVASPGKARSAQELPVFSSTGYIPFADSASLQPQEASYQYMPTYAYGQLPYSQPEQVAPQQNDLQGGMSQPSDNTQFGEQSYDEWAVPDTPGR